MRIVVTQLLISIACLFVILACPRALSGQTQTNKAGQAEQELTTLAHDECEAVLENHASVLDRILAAEFIMHTVDGHLVPKAQMGPYLRAALPPSIAGLCEIRDLTIKVSGHKATTEGRMRVRASAADGSEVPLQFHFNQKLVKRQRRWQATYIEFSLDQP
jgi:Domain of unknown function (DUF4440)